LSNAHFARSLRLLYFLFVSKTMLRAIVVSIGLRPNYRIRLLASLVLLCVDLLQTLPAAYLRP
jgi:hypothetical protein